MPQEEKEEKEEGEFRPVHELATEHLEEGNIAYSAVKALARLYTEGGIVPPHSIPRLIEAFIRYTNVEKWSHATVVAARTLIVHMDQFSCIDDGITASKAMGNLSIC